MSQRDLEEILADLPARGKLVKDRPYRQVWRFEYAGKPVYLKFYPLGGLRDAARRLFRGSPAVLEFRRLQLLQKANVPAPRGIALLMGLTINARKGDAVLIEGLEPSIQLDKYFNHLELEGRDAPDHHAIVQKVIELLEKLGRAHLGHSDLHLGNLLLKDGNVYLLDAYAVHPGGLTVNDISLLALSARPYATRTDLVRAWQKLGPGGAPPAENRRGPSVWRSLLERAFKNDRYFGHLDAGEWSGHFFKHAKFPHRWSALSRLDLTESDWKDAWPRIQQMMQSDQFEVLKRTRSGEVLAGEIIVGGRPLSVVVKRPFRKYWHRYLSEIPRGTRPRRAWTKAWKLVIRNIPTAWPLLLMEKRSLGYTTDALIVFERIEGQTLDSPEWHQRGTETYRELLFRVGRLLRRLEHSGLYLYDSKTTNWVVRDDPALGLVPMIIDVDGVRSIRQRSGGFKRLLRSLRENTRVPFHPEDALALARGYAPFATRDRLARLLNQPVAPEAASSPRPSLEPRG